MIEYKAVLADKRGNAIAVHSGSFDEVVKWMDKHKDEEGELYFTVSPSQRWD